MAMDSAGKVVVVKGLHTYEYMNGQLGSSGSSPSDQYAIDSQGNLYMLQSGFVSIAASSLANPQTIATGVAQLVMDGTGEIALFFGDGQLSYYSTAAQALVPILSSQAQVVVDRFGQLYSRGTDGTVYLVTPLGDLATDYLAQSIDLSSGNLVITYTTIGQFWHNLGGEGSAVGLPIGAEQNVAGGRTVELQNGEITWSPQTGVHIIPAPLSAAYDEYGGPTSFLGMPTSLVQTTNDVNGNAVGQVIYFQGGALFLAFTGQIIPVSQHIAQIYQSYQDDGRGLGAALSRQATSGSPIEVVTFTDGAIYWSPATGPRVLADVSTIHLLGQLADSDPSFSLGDSGWANPVSVLSDVANTQFGVQFSATGTLSLNLAQQTAYANIDFAGTQFDSDKLQALLNGQFVLPSINPSEVLTSMARTGTSNNYAAVQSNIYAANGAAAVYFSSSRFVDWASPETLARLTAQTVLGGGDATVNELEENLSAEFQGVIAWATRRVGNEAQALQDIAQAFQHGQVQITPVWVNYYYTAFGQQITEQHLGFTITISGLPAGPLAPQANMIGTATTAAAVTQGVTTDDIQNALGSLAISACNQLFGTHLNPTAFDLGASIESNLINQSLYQLLFQTMNLNESELALAYQGNPVINLLAVTDAGTRLQNAVNNELHQFNGDLQFTVKQLTFNTSTYELSAQIVLSYAHNWGTVSDILNNVGQTLSTFGQDLAGTAADWFQKETGVLASWWQNAGNSLPTAPWVATAISQLPQVLQDLGEPATIVKTSVGNLGVQIKQSPVGQAVGKALSGDFSLGLVDGDGFIPVN